MAILIFGIAYINSYENKIRSRIGKTYNFNVESNFAPVNINGTAKIISGDKLSLKVRITSDEENVFNANIDSTLTFKLRDESDFSLGEFRVSDFTKADYNSDTQTVSGYTYDGVINISYDLKQSLIKTADITVGSYSGFKTISHPKLLKNQVEIDQVTLNLDYIAKLTNEQLEDILPSLTGDKKKLIQEVLDRRQGVVTVEPVVPAAVDFNTERETKGPNYNSNLKQKLSSWRALQKGMSPTSVRNLLGAPHRVTGGSYTTFTYLADYSSGTVTFYNDKVSFWSEPYFSSP